MDLNISELHRFDRIIDVLASVANGNYSVQLEVTAEKDYLDSIAAGINMMIDDLQTNTIKLKYAENRVNAILGVIEQVARGKCNVSCETGEKNDIFDALGVSINMMIDDIKNCIEEINKNKIIMEEKEVLANQK